MKCPNCAAQSGTDAADCPSCGLVFAKWRERKEKERREAAAALEAIDAPKAPEPVKPANDRRVIAALLVAGWILWLTVYYQRRAPRRIIRVSGETGWGPSGSAPSAR
jgi:hypothetical protein